MVTAAIPTPNQVVTNPELFSSTFLKILDKEKKLVPFRWNKAQRDFHFKRTGRDLILKARQLGFSTYIQGELFRRAVTKATTSISLAHDGELTTKLRMMADRFYDNCKFGSIQPTRKYANASLASYPEFNSSCSIGTAGNLSVGRGDTYSDFHGSEVAFWRDAESIIAGAMQGGNPDVVLESTPNGAQGYFYELCMEALSRNGVWTLHFYPWWFDDSYRIPLVLGEQISLTDEERNIANEHSLDDEQIKWRRNKQKELKHLFQQEYPEDPITCFLTSGNSYFGNPMRFMNAPMTAEYNPEHEYIAGLDFGQTNDFTAMVVLDKTTKRQVDLLHINKLEWSEIRRRIVSKYTEWHCTRMAAESNSIGSVNIEALQYDGLSIIPFETTNISKAEICSNGYDAFDTGGWQLQDYPVQRHEYSIFVSSQTATGVWRLAAEGDGHDDTVIAGMIALWAAVTPIQIF
jgi:hypothetical protein